jgi:hypothetical protein
VTLKLAIVGGTTGGFDALDFHIINPVTTLTNAANPTRTITLIFRKTGVEIDPEPAPLSDGSSRLVFGGNGLRRIFRL